MDTKICRMNFRWSLPEAHSRAASSRSFSLLPSSYNQMRTVTLNYEVLANIYYARRNHKLDEWHVLCAVNGTILHAHVPSPASSVSPPMAPSRRRA